MKIILYVYEYPPLGGGVGNAIKNILKEFKNFQGLEIDVITSSIDNKHRVEKLYDNVKLHKIRIGERKVEDFHKQKPFHMFVFTTKAYFYTWKLIRKNKYDLNHFFGFPGGLVSLLFKWKMPYIISLRGVDVPGYNPRFDKFMWFYRPLSRMIWKNARYIVPNSKKLQLLAEETLISENYKVIPNGVDTQKFTALGDNKKYDKFTVTAGGTLFGKKKGLEFLIRGFAEFNNKFSDTELHLIGSGDLEPVYRNIIKELDKEECIKILGRKSNDWISENLPKYHVFCLPSLNEGMSNAALEALASGLPVLLTNTGGTEELLENGVNGFIIEKESSSDIAEKLTLLYSDKDLKINMSKCSRDRALKMQWSEVAKDYIKIYQSIT